MSKNEILPLTASPDERTDRANEINTIFRTHQTYTGKENVAKVVNSLMLRLKVVMKLVEQVQHAEIKHNLQMIHMNLARIESIVFPPMTRTRNGAVSAKGSPKELYLRAVDDLSVRLKSAITQSVDTYRITLYLHNIHDSVQHIESHAINEHISPQIMG